MSSVHTRNSMTCPGALVSLRESSPSTASLPARLEHFSRVARCEDSVESELDPMIGADRIAPGDQVMSLAGPDEGRANSDRRLAFVRFDVVDLGDVVLGHAAFQHVDRFEVDPRKRLEILRSDLATFFETWRARHAP